MKTYSVIKLFNKADAPPYYLLNIPLEGIYAYFFNWHTDKATASINEIAAWYADKRGWFWRED